MKRKICIVTGARADYGLLRLLMQEIKDDPLLVLQIIATGGHLSPEFGLTYREIEADGFTIDRKVEVLVSSDTTVGITKSMGLGLIGFSDAFESLKPDIVVLLGDRFEIFSAAIVALVAKIPVAHIHGGEQTEGSIDDALRHSITKMASLHFVAADEYLKRVIQLGEVADRVFLVGGLGVDAIHGSVLLDRSALEKDLGISFQDKNLLVTYQPPTAENIEIIEFELKQLLLALDKLNDVKLIFTMPNPDNGSRLIARMVNDFINCHDNACGFSSLGYIRYWSCLNVVDGVIGNSSSGLTEVPTFMKGTINIGNRQKGRLFASSVINCQPNVSEISKALDMLYSIRFKEALPGTINPYGNGGASKKIIEVLKTVELNNLTQKKFYDIPDLDRKNMGIN
jgi:GDP/UDP-N,N'-diacetylbacillosamine 2-epimerase (hydrolysing)